MKKEKNMLEEPLKIRPLKIGFVKKDYIGNFDSNYEEYLTEFLNNSKFVIDNGNKKFHIISKQENGEYDVTNGIYALDYKLLIDSKTAENMSYYSETISIDKNGEVSYGMSKKIGNWRRYYFPNILKGLSKKDFEKIESCDKKDLNEIQKLVKDYLDKVLKDKNILYFIPYNLFFDNKKMNQKEIKSVVDKLSEGLKGFIEYRISYIEDKDTYFCFISDKNMVFLKYENSLELYDIVPIEKSGLYLQIADISESW